MESTDDGDGDAVATSDVVIAVMMKTKTSISDDGTLSALVEILWHSSVASPTDSPAMSAQHGSVEVSAEEVTSHQLQVDTTTTQSNNTAPGIAFEHRRCYSLLWLAFRSSVTVQREYNISVTPHQVSSSEITSHTFLPWQTRTIIRVRAVFDWICPVCADA
eukprot:scaffold370_cov192-Alexandrium_tamarense.AAC.5